MTNAVEASIWWRWRAAPGGKGPSQCISHPLHLLHLLSLSEPSPIALCGGPGERDTIVCPPSLEGTSCFPKHLSVIPVAQLHVWQCPQLAALPTLQEQLSFDRAPCHLSPAACPLGDFRLLNLRKKWGADYFSLLSLARFFCFVLFVLAFCHSITGCLFLHVSCITALEGWISFEISFISLGTIGNVSGFWGQMPEGHVEADLAKYETRCIS